MSALLDERESRPVTTRAASVSTAIKNGTSVPPRADLLSDLDAMAQSLNGYLVVRVVIDDAGHLRTYLYRSARAAERCVERARERGRYAHVSLCSLLPAGVVTGLGGGV